MWFSRPILEFPIPVSTFHSFSERHHVFICFCNITFSLSWNCRRHLERTRERERERWVELLKRWRESLASNSLRDIQNPLVFHPPKTLQNPLLCICFSSIWRSVLYLHLEIFVRFIAYYCCLFLPIYTHTNLHKEDLSFSHWPYLGLHFYCGANFSSHNVMSDAKLCSFWDFDIETIQGWTWILKQKPHSLTPQLV